MPIFLNKNLNAIPVYNVDADGNIVSGGGSGGAAGKTQLVDAAGNPVSVQTANNAAFGVDERAIATRGINYVYDGGAFHLQKGDSLGTRIHGTIPAGAADDGANPVKMGGVYNPAGRLIASGQRSDVQMGAYGSMKMQLMVPDGQTPINATSNDADATNGANALSTSSFNRVWNGSAWDRQRGDVTGTWVHAPASSVANLSGTIAASGGTAEVIFANTAKQEIINPSTSVLWARWGGNPTVNGAGSFPIAPGGTYSVDRVGGTIVLLSTAANQPYTVYRFQ